MKSRVTIQPLFQEHKLIREVLALLQEEANKTTKIPPGFIDKVIDFFHTYADRCHHGKEEDILFQSLMHKPLTPELKRLLNELLEEHKIARGYVSSLEKLKNQDEQIRAIFEKIVALYTQHIEKENVRFFIPVLEYFSDEELDKMLKTFLAFDQKMIHEKYAKVKEEIFVFVKKSPL